MSKFSIHFNRSRGRLFFRYVKCVNIKYIHFAKYLKSKKYDKSMTKTLDIKKKTYLKQGRPYNIYCIFNQWINLLIISNSVYFYFIETIPNKMHKFAIPACLVSVCLFLQSKMMFRCFNIVCLIWCVFKSIRGNNISSNDDLMLNFQSKFNVIINVCIWWYSPWNVRLSHFNGERTVNTRWANGEPTQSKRWTHADRTLNAIWWRVSVR